MDKVEIFEWCRNTFKKIGYTSAWESDDPEIWEFAVPFKENENIIKVTIEFVYEWHSIEIEFSSDEDEKNFYSLVREEEKRREKIK